MNRPVVCPIKVDSEDEVLDMKSKLGSPAVDFELSDTEGRVHRLEQYRGKWLLLVFHRHLG